jgi:hypothetical protein
MSLEELPFPKPIKCTPCIGSTWHKLPAACLIFIRPSSYQTRNKYFSTLLATENPKWTRWAFQGLWKKTALNKWQSSREGRSLEHPEKTALALSCLPTDFSLTLYRAAALLNIFPTGIMQRVETQGAQWIVNWKSPERVWLPYNTCRKQINSWK